MSVPYPKGGGVVWSCVKDNIIKEKGAIQSYWTKRGLIINYLEKMRVGGF